MQVYLKLYKIFVLLLLLGTSLLICNCDSHNISASSINAVPPDDEAEITYQKTTVFLLPTNYDNLDALLKEGDIAPDFTLFTVDGEPFNLYHELDKGIPILLITGSYSCPFTRRKIPVINELTSSYNQKLTVALVYIVEAHPQDVENLYLTQDSIWIPKENLKKGIAIDMPKTYKERKEVCSVMQDTFSLNPIVLVDNPDNEFWMKYGQAPVMAHLIKPDKTISLRQIKFNSKLLKKRIDLLLGDS